MKCPTQTVSNQCCQSSAVDSGGPAARDSVTIGAVTGQQNQTLDIAGGDLRAFRFRVTVN